MVQAQLSPWPPIEPTAARLPNFRAAAQLETGKTRHRAVQRAKIKVVAALFRQPIGSLPQQKVMSVCGFALRTNMTDVIGRTMPMEQKKHMR